MYKFTTVCLALSHICSLPRKLFMKVQKKTANQILSVPFMSLKKKSNFHRKYLRYRRIPKVTSIVTFGFSNPWMALLPGGHYFREVVTSGKSLYLRYSRSCVETIMPICSARLKHINCTFTIYIIILTL